MIMSGADLLERHPNPSEDEIRRGLDGKLLPLHRLRAHHQRRPKRGGRCQVTMQATPASSSGSAFAVARTHAW